MSDHSDRAHALLSASGSERWFSCTPSARLEDTHGVKTTSKYAEEGTLAHELAELTLNYEVTKIIDENTYTERLADIINDKSFTDEMIFEVQKYVDYCAEQYAAAQSVTPDALIAIEQRIDLRAFIKDGFGTDDCIIMADGELEVIDLKYGKGVAVSATANKQLMIYGLGALYRYAFMYDVKSVKLTIVQPRMDNISSWSITPDDLYNWAETELKPKAELAYAGEGNFNAGSWCKFCSVKNRCTELANSNLALAKMEFSKPNLLTDAEIAEILKKAPVLAEWANSVVEYATAEAYTKNKVFPGFKLVEGISRRKWVDEEVVAKHMLNNIDGIEDEDIFVKKLKSITDIEKMLTKKVFAEKMSAVVIKPQGKPTLVPSTDNRQALGINQAKSDFS